MSEDGVDYALTPEEWDEGEVEIEGSPGGFVCDTGAGLQVIVAGWPDESPSFSRRGGHALAALCLHGQPFGFDHEDASEVRKAAAAYQHEGWYEGAERLLDLADRIEALLPPTP